MLLNGHPSNFDAAIVLIGGGGSAPDTHQAALMARFINQAGGPDAPILILTTATGSPEWQRQRTGDFLRGLGARNLHAPLIRTRAEAEDPANADLITAARGIYLTGGDQSKYSRILSGTATGAALRHAFERGTRVIGGTSAGAHVMGQVMIAGSFDTIMRRRGSVLLREGFGLLSDFVVIDSHFSRRRRVPRMLTTLGKHPHLLGIGLDEDTGLVINADGVAEILGAGLVHFFSRTPKTFRHWAVGHGARFDLTRRNLLSEPMLNCGDD